MRKRNHRIVFYLNDHEFESLDRKVKRTNLSREAFLRKAIQDIQIKEAPPADLSQFIREIRRVGNNINQLATIANAQGLVDVPQLRREILELRDIEKLIISQYTNR